ncbi:OsmC family protein [Clostridium estertheticum]|uniref:OsmC family protein n=1 Tax=Clostridium estertheticum TaxID=238834 RepID=UPI0013EECB6A|nr:OsmC family protein [Clostridium estertheticum]MBZ9608836.1 OsmC family protein [Clostridium estertheticum]
MMNAVVKWLGDGAAFECTTPEGAKFVLAGPAEMNNGKVLGPKPIEILLHAVAACTSVDIVTMLKARGAQISEYEVIVNGERGSVAPKPIEKIDLSYNIKGKGMTPEMIEYVLKTAFEVESGVANTYKSDITWSFNLIEE